MTQEEAFLAAIRANPTDDTARLMYADWLEERGDVRGEFIRLRVESQKGLGAGRGRKQRAARLDELAATVDLEWASHVFAVPKLQIQGYQRAKRPVKKPVTKFGGQPVWLEEPAWPYSRAWNRPMHFVCQIALPPFFGEAAGKVAYWFLTQGTFEERHEVITLDQGDPDKGENAVILQPGGDRAAPTVVLPLGARGRRRKGRPIRTVNQPTGPSLYDDKGSPCEFTVELEAGADPEYIPLHSEIDDAASERHFYATWGDKIGGVPTYGNGNFDEIESLAHDSNWRLLLQLTLRHDAVPFEMGTGVNTAFVFISRDGKRGLFIGG
jgi:uncharacterized protein (TIGR02996 family)